MNLYARAALLFVGLSFATPAIADDCSLRLLASLDMVPTDEPRILMPANINGTQVQLLIDTGSGLSSISQKAVDVLKLKPQATDWQSYDLYGNMSQQFVSSTRCKSGP